MNPFRIQNTVLGGYNNLPPYCTKTCSLNRICRNSQKMNKFSKHKLNNLKYKFKPWRKKTKNYYKIMNKNTVFKKPKSFS